MITKTFSVAVKKFKCTQCFLWRYNQFVTLETQRELEPKCVPQLFLDGYWGRAGQLLVIFFRVLSNNPRSLCERLHDPVFLSFLKCRMFRRKSISPVFLLFNFQSVSGHFPYLTLPKPVMPLNKWVLLHKVTFISTKRNLLISLARSLVDWRKLELLPTQNCSPKLLTNVYLQLISY